MSFVFNDVKNEQMSMFDSMLNLTDREIKFLKNSWANYFAEYIFPNIDEEPFSVLYGESNSRPNTPVNVLVGALFIQQLTGQTDEEIVESLMFDIRYQYALHTTSFAEQPLSDRSLGRFRERLFTYLTKSGVDLMKITEAILTDKLAYLMNIDQRLMRMDSMMISANIKKMSRLELIYTTVSNLAKKMESLDIKIPSEQKHYTEKNDRNKVVYHNRTDDAESKIETILLDAKILLKMCSDEMQDTSEYLLLVRVLDEQTITDDKGEYHLKSGKDGTMDSSILQNPADPDATYREKAGKQHVGYCANFVESSNEYGDTLITDYQFENNTYSDKKFIDEMVEKIDNQPADSPVTIVADGAYTADEIAAAKKNINIVNTNLTGKDTPDICADFEFNQDGTKVEKCPGGHQPIDCSFYKTSGSCIASFNKECCEGCPHFNECKPSKKKNHYQKRISLKSKKRAEHKRKRSSEEFSKLTRYRNGVETIPSILRRRYNVDNIPVHGKNRMAIFFSAKIMAINFQKLCKYMQGSARRALNTALA